MVIVNVRNLASKKSLHKILIFEIFVCKFAVVVFMKPIYEAYNNGMNLMVNSVLTLNK